jgi:hypothetical protein
MSRRSPIRHLDSDLILAIGRIEGKMDQLIVRFDEVKADQAEHDTRITNLEHALTRLKTYAYAGSALISIAATAALKYFGFA